MSSFDLAASECRKMQMTALPCRAFFGLRAKALAQEVEALVGLARSQPGFVRIQK